MKKRTKYIVRYNGTAQGNYKALPHLIGDVCDIHIRRNKTRIALKFCMPSAEMAAELRDTLINIIKNQNNYDKKRTI